MRGNRGPCAGIPRNSRRRAEKLLSYASPLLLYAEEIDPHTGRHLGNFPQAFSRLALINAVMHLIREDQRTCYGSTPGGSGHVKPPRAGKRAG